MRPTSAKYTSQWYRHARTKNRKTRAQQITHKTVKENKNTTTHTSWFNLSFAWGVLLRHTKQNCGKRLTQACLVLLIFRSAKVSSTLPHTVLEGSCLYNCLFCVSKRRQARSCYSAFSVPDGILSGTGKSKVWPLDQFPIPQLQWITITLDPFSLDYLRLDVKYS